MYVGMCAAASHGETSERTYDCANLPRVDSSLHVSSPPPPRRMAIVELYAVDLFLDPSLSMHEPFVTALSCLL